MSAVNYSKWNNIEVSDDEDDTHPNVDTASLFKWRHEARIEREEIAKAEKQKKKEISERRQLMINVAKQELRKVEENESTNIPEEKVEQMKQMVKSLEKEEKEFLKKEAELERYQREHPEWNVDNISQDKHNRSVINSASSIKPVSLASTNLDDFKKHHLKDAEEFGMLRKYNDSMKFLLSHPELVGDMLVGYLSVWCIDLHVQEKTKLEKHIAHQAVVMQYILELGKSCKRDPRDCIPLFFQRIQENNKEYQKVFESEIESFLERVKERADIRIAEAQKQYKAEQEKRMAEKEKRMGPGGLDPAEVFPTLPQKLQDAIEKRDMILMKEGFAELSKLGEEEAMNHYKRMVDSGLWLPQGGAQKKEGEAAGEEKGEEEAETGKDNTAETPEGEEEWMWWCSIL